MVYHDISQEQLLLLITQAVQAELQKRSRQVPVGISVRHIHLTRADVDRLFGTFFETEQNDSYCNIYADVDKHCTKLAKPYLTVSMWLGDFCVEAVRPLSISEQKAVLSTIQKSYAKSDCEELLKEWMEASE